MPAFRFYFIDNSRKIVEATALECADDRQAIEKAKKLLEIRTSAHGVEVWDRARRVAQLMRE